MLDSDAELAAQADYILSIVPPRDALTTAKRITATKTSDRSKPLYFLDLNAVSPGRARSIAEEFKKNAPGVKYVDGGIIGGPPQPLAAEADNGDTTNSSSRPGADWKRPAIPLSGPDQLPSDHLAKLLNVTHVSFDIGSASGLKCCFASMVKGLIALSIQSFSTAQSLGVYSELQRLLEHFQPAMQKSTTRMITEIPPKAGRWVEEMLEIGRCFGEEGGWDNARGFDGADVFKRFAEVYRTLAEDTVLGQERLEHRIRGTTAVDVAAAVIEGLEKMTPEGFEKKSLRSPKLFH